MRNEIERDSQRTRERRECERVSDSGKDKKGNS